MILMSRTTDLTEVRRLNLLKLLNSLGRGAMVAVADRIGSTPGYISHLASDKNSKGHRNMGEKTARKIEEAFNLPDLAFDKNNNNTIKPASIRPVRPLGKVPLIHHSDAAAGTLFIDDKTIWISCPVDHSKYTYAVKVWGDQMVTPFPSRHSYAEGDIIFVDPDRPAKSGCRVLAKLYDTDEVIFREYRQEAGKNYLKPLNTQYEMIIMTENMRILGIVIAHLVPEIDE
jgi:SOS-response transcriptional repressor LexA